MRLHCLLPCFVPHDAQGALAGEMRALLRRLGFDSDIFAQEIAPELRLLARPTAELPEALGPEDAVLYFHGVGSTLVPLLGSLPGRKLLYYHNITPSRFLAPYDPGVARALDDGRLQLAALRDVVDGAIAHSRFSADELTAGGFPHVWVVPPPLDGKRVAHPGDERLYRKLCDGRANLLFVGRVQPHKKIEDLVELAAGGGRSRAATPPARSGSSWPAATRRPRRIFAWCASAPSRSARAFASWVRSASTSSAPATARRTSSSR
ncbi:MAG: glycosyltransferase family protein [Myxococcales bacterium]